MPAGRAWIWALIAVAAVGGLAVAMATRIGGDPATVASRAEADLAAGRLDRAEAALSRLAALRPPTADDRVLAARVALARDRIAEALDALGHVPDDRPGV